MSTYFQKAVFFLMGCVCTAAVVVLLGAANNQADSPRYDADFDTIMGGLGGLTVEITDHAEQKAYLYVFPSKKQQGIDGPAPQLAVTVDLTSAGRPTLEASLVERDTREVEE